tara:strand:+ start:4095 stop:6356 length:2262 start_codon:yes stop_codon:yes gene_type:complete
MNSDFLTSNNITVLINTVRHNVKQEINYDITNDKKYINILKKLVKTIHEANVNKPVTTEYMNNIVVTKCVPFLVTQIGKTKKTRTNTSNIYGNLPIVTHNRPETTRNTDYSRDNSQSSSNQGNLNSTDFSSLQLSGAPGQLNNMTSHNFNNMSYVNDRPQPIPGNDDNNMYNSTPMVNRELEPPPRQMPALTSTSISGKLPTQNLSMDISSLPAPTNLNIGNDLMDNVNKLSLSEPSKSINTKDLDDGVDLAKRLADMQKDREYETKTESNDQFNNNSQTLDDRNNQVLNVRGANTTSEEATFFKKLAENNKSISTETTAKDAEMKSMNLSKLAGNYMDGSSYDVDESAYDSYNTNILQLGTTNASVAKDSVDDFRNNLPNTSRTVSEEISSNASRNQLLIPNERNDKAVSKEYIDSTFQSTNYQYERRKRKIVSLDISDNLPNLPDNKKVIDNISSSYWGKFRIKLQDELIIDKLSDIYIESIIINNPAQANQFSNLYLIVDIEEFNIKTLSNNPYMMDKFVLPNENTEINGSTKIMKYHLKSNYVATVNPMKLNSLTFNITNENGDSVENTYVSTGVTIDANFKVGSAAATDMDISDTAANTFRILDAVYNSSYKFIGNIHITNTANSDIQFMKTTNVHLFSGETLYFPSGKTDNFLTAAGTNGSTSISVDADPTTDFSVGDKVYLGTGIILGKISAMDRESDPETITFESAITQYIPSGARLYKSNPQPRVFGSNDKSNRIILELVVMPR